MNEERKPSEPRTLGEHQQQAQRRLRAENYSLRTQLQATRAQLEQALLPATGSARPGLLRAAADMGVDRRLSDALLVDLMRQRDRIVSELASLGARLADDVRKIISDWQIGLIYPQAAQTRIDLALAAFAATQRAQLLALAIYCPGRAENPCPECGRQLGSGADDCSTCAQTGAARVEGAGHD